jgi:hypothetical protein
MRLSFRVLLPAAAFAAAFLPFPLDVRASESGACRCGEAMASPEQPPPDPLLRVIRPKLGSLDEIAALQAVHVGLTDAADGATFVWVRPHGRLGGTVRPTASFKDAEGRVCRHLVVTLKSGTYVRAAEGIACRQPDGSWALEG